MTGKRTSARAKFGTRTSIQIIILHGAGVSISIGLGTEVNTSCRSYSCRRSIAPFYTNKLYQWSKLKKLKKRLRKKIENVNGKNPCHCHEWLDDWLEYIFIWDIIHKAYTLGHNFLKIRSWGVFFLSNICLWELAVISEKFNYLYKKFFFKNIFF